MKTYHATDRKNLRGIMRAGLLASMATGSLEAVWCVGRAFIDDAVLHAGSKRRVALKDIVVLELDVPRKWVKRFSRPGYLYIPRDVPPCRIKVWGRVSVVQA